MNLLRQFVAAIGSLATELQLLGNSIDQNTETIRTAIEGNRHHQEPQDVRAEVGFTESVERNTNTNNERQYRMQKSLRDWTVAAFIAAVVYAAIGVAQLRQTKKAIQLNVAVDSPDLHIAGMRLTTDKEGLQQCKDQSSSRPDAAFASLFPEDASATQVCIVIENQGIRPATLRNYYIQHIVSDESPTVDIPHCCSNGWVEDSDGLRPGDKNLGGILPPFKLTASDLQELKTGETLWIYGMLDSDMFYGSAKPHFWWSIWRRSDNRFTEDRRCCKKGDECPRRGN